LARRSSGSDLLHEIIHDGREWHLTVQRSHTIRTPITAAMVSAERAVGGHQVGGLYKSNSTVHTFAEAASWVCEELGLDVGEPSA
jgi:hypothetical protein